MYIYGSMTYMYIYSIDLSFVMFVWATRPGSTPGRAPQASWAGTINIMWYYVWEKVYFIPNYGEWTT